MLPFKKKQQIGLIYEKRKPDQPDAQDEHDPIDDCADDILAAIDRRDAKALSAALRAAFEIFDSQPHDEFPHDEDEQESE